jgi:hypothetical protein
MRRIRWTTVVGAVATAALATAALAVPAGASDEKIPINDTVNAQTTLKTLQQTVTVPPGTFKGSIDDVTGVLTGKLKLPNASTTLSLVGIGLVTATFHIAPTKPVRGTLGAGLVLHAKSVFNIDVRSVTPLGTQLNLVGSKCATSKPVTLKISGVTDPLGTSTYSGTYTIPPLANCGLATVALNLVVPGSGNTFTATFKAAG